MLPITLEELLDSIRTQFADKLEACNIEILEEREVVIPPEAPTDATDDAPADMMSGGVKTMMGFAQGQGNQRPF
jgi:hypothetical protein